MKAIYNKFFRAFVFDPSLKMWGLILIGLLGALFIQLRIVGGQLETLRQVKAERSLVQRIPSMEKTIRDNTIVTAGGGHSPAKVELRLEGITIQEGSPYALIDGIVYGEGDFIGNYTVEKILMEPGGGGQASLKDKETQEMKILYVPPPK